MIRHIVIWRLRAEDQATRAADVATIVAALSELPTVIPQIRTLSVGPNIADHPSNWDLALVIDYNTRADLDAYRVHPEHLRVVQIVNARVSQRVSIDLEI